MKIQKKKRIFKLTGDNNIARVIDRKCPKCGNHLKTDWKRLWCSYVKCNFYMQFEVKYD